MQYKSALATQLHRVNLCADTSTFRTSEHHDLQRATKR